nr:hypothetical protein GCM10017745_66940 [Saccharothrix mutabilis subsp. capreolus]
MVLGRAVSNKELEDHVGFRLSGQERIELNSLQFVDSHKEGSLFVHKLTARGLEWCAQELRAKTPPPPAARSRLVRPLYVLLDTLGQYLRHNGLHLTDVFGAHEGDLTSEEIQHRIITVYRGLARAPRDWVGLVELRPMLGDIPVAEVDAVLKELSRTGQAHLVPESNRKALTPADHEAAIRIGGEDNHLISIEAS